MEDLFANALGQAPSKTTERRDSSRVRFSVMAKVTEVTSDTTLEVRIADIGRLGCYADSLNPFPPGTSVRISFRRAGTPFESAATVVYSVTGLGMGLKFVDLAAVNAAQIEKWLFEGDSQELLAGAVETNFEAAAGEKKALRRLVELLIQKRVLTGLESEEVLEILRHKQFREQP